MSGQMLHYQQESARHQQDIATLRRQKRDLEVALNDLQSSVTIKQEQYEEQIGEWRRDPIVYLYAYKYGIKYGTMYVVVLPSRVWWFTYYW